MNSDVYSPSRRKWRVFDNNDFSCQALPSFAPCPVNAQHVSTVGIRKLSVPNVPSKKIYRCNSRSWIRTPQRSGRDVCSSCCCAQSDQSNQKKLVAELSWSLSYLSQWQTVPAGRLLHNICWKTLAFKQFSCNWAQSDYCLSSKSYSCFWSSNYCPHSGWLSQQPEFRGQIVGSLQFLPNFDRFQFL